MALTVDDLDRHLNGVPASDKEHMLPRILAAATAHIERLLGFKIDDDDEFPQGTPADLELAVLQLGAFWYEHRGSGLLDQTDVFKELPFGVDSVIRNYRNWVF